MADVRDRHVAAASSGRHQADRLDGRGLVVAAMLVVVVLVACAYGARALERALARHSGRDPRAAHPVVAPRQAGPPLQPDAPADLAAYRREKDAALHAYRWIDRAHGVAAVPIDVAMAIVVAQAHTHTAEPQ